MFLKGHNARPWIFCVAAALLLAAAVTAIEIGDQESNVQGYYTDNEYGTELDGGAELDFFVGKIYGTINPEEASEAQTEYATPTVDDSELHTEHTTSLEEDSEAQTEYETPLEQASEAQTEYETPLEQASEAQTEYATPTVDDSELYTEQMTSLEEDGEAQTEYATPTVDDSELHTEQMTSLEEDNETLPELVASTEGESREEQMEAALRKRRIYRAVGGFLAVVGMILAAWSIFLMRQKEAYLGPEPEVLLGVFSAWRLSQPSGGMLIVRAVSCWLLFFLLLVCLRGLWWWFRTGFVPEWSTAHRMGMRLTETSGKRSRYLIVQFGWTVLAVVGGGLLLSNFGKEIWTLPQSVVFPYIRAKLFVLLLGAAFLFAALMAAYCFVKAVRDVDHLSEQIRHLHAGEPISAGDGAFSEEERKLIDLDHQRDEAIHTAVTSERFKVDLISNVSHDLRTPLTAILGYGELLKGESLSSDGSRQLEELNRKAGYMYELVESLFELTKVSSGVVESKKERIDLIRLLEQTIGLFDDELKAHNLNIRRHYEAESAILVTDGARMHQVFANLIGNAIKYTLPETRIHLEVKSKGQEYLIRMVNIAAYEMDFDANEILERFARGDKARSTKGSGLGLAIAKTYTESVGGRFQVLIDGEQFSAIVTLPRN